MGLILATVKIPGMSKGEQDVENLFKGKNLPSSSEHLKQLCTGATVARALQLYCAVLGPQ